jgi:hypothetical protein
MNFCVYSSGCYTYVHDLIYQTIPELPAACCKLFIPYSDPVGFSRQYEIDHSIINPRTSN